MQRINLQYPQHLKRPAALCILYSFHMKSRYLTKCPHWTSIILYAAVWVSETPADNAGIPHTRRHSPAKSRHTCSIPGCTPATALYASIVTRIHEPALPFTPLSSACPRAPGLTKYKFSVFFVSKNYFFEIPLYFCTNFAKNMLIFCGNHI